MHHFIPRNWPEFVSATCRQILSPDPDPEILLEVNLNFQVRLTLVLAFGIFSRGNGSGSFLLKYDNSSPFLLVISVPLDKQIFVSLLPFSKQSMMSLEDVFDSNHNIMSKQIQLSEIACVLCLKNDENYLDFM